MGKKIAIPDLVKLYLEGMTPRQIGERYGVSVSSVGDRLKRRGYSRPFRRLRPRFAGINRIRLERLYTVERLSLAKISAAFGVSVYKIAEALKFYAIPSRTAGGAGGRYPGYFRVLRSLRMGDSAVIESRDPQQESILHDSARKIRIKIAVSHLPEGRLKVTRISIYESRRLAKIALADRRQLEIMHLGQKLPPGEISRRLGIDREIIRQALVFYGISDCRPPRTGKYSQVFEQLMIGEAIEIECSNKYPHGNLYTIAARLSIRISVHKIGGGRFQVTRLS